MLQPCALHICVLPTGLCLQPATLHCRLPPWLAQNDRLTATLLQPST